MEQRLVGPRQNVLEWAPDFAIDPLNPVYGMTEDSASGDWIKDA
jgi:hypothetical protein